MSCATTPCQGPVKEEKPRRGQRPPVDKSICHRCREAKSLYMLRGMSFCRDCFENLVHSRVSRRLNKPLVDPDNKASNARPNLQSGNVLIAVSGGAGSTLLLDLLDSRGYYGHEDNETRDITKGQKNIVWTRGWAVHVDFSSVTGLESHAEALGALAADHGLQFAVIKAEEAFDPALRTRLRQATGGAASATAAPSAMGVDLSAPDLPLISAPSSSTATPLESFQALLAALPAPSRPELLASILNALLDLAACELPNISHMVLGETTTREAARVISGTAAGRGWALPLELAGARSSGSYVRLKPMKDIALKDAALWCHGRGLATFNERRWDNTVPGSKRDGKGNVASIEALTEKFIATLNISHSSTVSTIIKTGNKLRFTGDESGPKCPVCQIPVDPSALQWKAQSALTSLPGRGPQDSVSAGSGVASTSAHLAPLLCYSCLTTFTPLSAAQRDRLSTDAAPLPLWIGERVDERLGRDKPRAVTEEEMRAQVQQFLIDE